jgi:hypothetical protein
VEIFGISIGGDHSSDEDVLADLTLEERDRYLTWWRTFTLLDRLNWVAIGLILAPAFASLYGLKNWKTFALLGCALFIVTRVWLRVLTCPRCGATYSGGLITVFQRFSSLSTCYGCDLSKRALRVLETRGY